MSTLEYPNGARRRAFKPLLATGDDGGDACTNAHRITPAHVSTLEYRRVSTLEYHRVSTLEYHRVSALEYPCVSTLEYPCGAKVGFNAFLDDVALAAAVRAHHGAWGTAELAELGAKVLRALTCCMGYSGYSHTHGVLWGTHTHMGRSGVLTHTWDTPGPTGLGLYHALCLLCLV